MFILYTLKTLLLQASFLKEMWKKFDCCECKLRMIYRRKEKLRKLYGSDDDDSDEIIEAEEETLYEQATKVKGRSLYLLTGNEMFNTPSYYPRIKDDTFKLIEFKVATAEEVFNRKLSEGEYIEALEIAKLYKLDTDVVYQTQWINSAITVFAINEYLLKVKSKNWVIHECLERVADNLRAQKALIDHGLKLSDLDSVLSLSGNTHCNIAYNDADSSEKKKETDEEIIKRTDFASLTFEQKDIISSRLKLLRYSKRLKTYEIILGGQSFAKERYDSNFFSVFRNQCAFEAAISFARDENPKGVSAMLTYHSEETLKHWLNIVSNFPETMSPVNYQSLLPKCSSVKSEENVFEWQITSGNEEDWCQKYFLSAFPSSSEQNAFEQEFYVENKDLLDFSEIVLTKSLVSRWFHKRARQIEHNSSLVKYALKLVEIGIDNNVPNLEKLFDDLDTYATVVYECLPLNIAVTFEFSKFETISDEQKIEYLMHAAVDNPDHFTSRIKSHLIPFLRKCEKYSETVDVFYTYLSNYVTSISKNDLAICSTIFEKKDSQNKNFLIEDKEHLLSLAVECIYACEQSNQLQAACTIIECLPPREEDSTDKYAPFYERLDLLDKHLGVADLLEEYNCFVTVKQVRDMQMDKNGEEIKRLITQITRLGAKKTEPYFKEKEWFQMFNDLLEMREDCFEDCITLDEIYEIFVNALLTSGRKENFGLASSYMQLMNDPSVVRKKKLIPYKKSVEILVLAARDYINSANSISDDVIDLAKQCLFLINDVEKCENEMVREEMDFLEALDLLYKEFNVKLLPIQIRLIQEPKLQLVSEILSEDSRAYRRWRKLLKVCELLKVCKSDTEKVRNGKILTLIGGFAYAAEDLKECMNICNFIMNNEYVSGCNLCKKLAFSDLFEDNETKLDMLAFVLSYCEDKTGEELEYVLDKIREIKVKLKLRNQAVVGPEKRLVDFGVNQVSKSAQKLSSWISSLSSFKK